MVRRERIEFVSNAVSMYSCFLLSFFLSRSVCLVRGVAIGLVAVLGGWVGRFVDTSWDIFILVGQEEQVCLFP